MDLTTQHGYHEMPAEERKTKAVAGGTVGESIVGAVAIILSIIGLAGANPGLLASIAAIFVGIGLMLEGAAVATRFSHAVADTSRSDVDISDLGGGVTTELIGGAVGVVLGILGLVGAATFSVIAAAAIVMGAALVMGSGATSRISTALISSRIDNETLRSLSREVMAGASSVQLLCGLTAIALGIVALASSIPAWLDLVAMLVLGSAVFMGGSAFAGRIMSVFRR